MSMPGYAEAIVRELDKRRGEVARLESYLRQLRLGRGVEMVRFRFRAGVYGFGWLNEKAEDMPKGMESEFYSFLVSRLEAAELAVRRQQSTLRSLAAESTRTASTEGGRDA